MYDADVSGDIDDVYLLSGDDLWEENSFSSGTSNLPLDPVLLLEDRPSQCCMSPASDVQERGIDKAVLNDSIERLRRRKSLLPGLRRRGPGSSAVCRTHLSVTLTKGAGVRMGDRFTVRTVSSYTSLFPAANPTRASRPDIVALTVTNRALTCHHLQRK
ncbi:hypothetical protein OUZ56_011703 [Daphnia magna]|uniref:Uncharacterized protein n=1 Tax=Daphnia magna TaxID=35525 RepID=A0ABQ9Z0Z9_9CRUS|nr:hypothetical protein OUZ56_011703 [Daphnia magna]